MSTILERLVEKYPEGLNGEKWNMYFLSMNPSITLEFIKKHPEGFAGIKWCFYSMSKNPNIDTDFIEYIHNIYLEGKESPYFYTQEYILENLHLVQTFMDGYDHLTFMPEDKEYYTSGDKEYHKNNFSKAFMEMNHWYMNFLSYNPCLTTTFLEKYPNGLPTKRSIKNSEGSPIQAFFPWNTNNLSFNQSIIKDESFLDILSSSARQEKKHFLEKYSNGFCNQHWAIYHLSKIVSLDFIEKHLDWPWSMQGLSESIHLTPEFVEKYIEGLPDTKSLYIPVDLILIKETPMAEKQFLINSEGSNILSNRKWIMYSLSKNSKILPSFIEKYIEGLPIKGNITTNFKGSTSKWSLEGLCRNPSITMEFLEKYTIGNLFDILPSSGQKKEEYHKNVEKLFDCSENSDFWSKTDHLSLNPALTLEFLEKYENKTPYGDSWNISLLSMNLVITPSFIEKHLNGFEGSPWDMEFLCSNISMSEQFLNQYFDTIIPSKTIDNTFLKGAKLPTKSEIEESSKRSTAYFYFRGCTKNPAISPSFIEKYINMLPPKYSMIRSLSQNTFSIVEKKYRQSLKSFYGSVIYIINERSHQNEYNSVIKTSIQDIRHIIYKLLDV